MFAWIAETIVSVINALIWLKDKLNGFVDWIYSWFNRSEAESAEDDERTKEENMVHMTNIKIKKNRTKLMKEMRSEQNDEQFLKELIKQNKKVKQDNIAQLSNNEIIALNKSIKTHVRYDQVIKQYRIIIDKGGIYPTAVLHVKDRQRLDSRSDYRYFKQYDLMQRTTEEYLLVRVGKTTGKFKRVGTVGDITGLTRCSTHYMWSDDDTSSVQSRMGQDAIKGCVIIGTDTIGSEILTLSGNVDRIVEKDGIMIYCTIWLRSDVDVDYNSIMLMSKKMVPYLPVAHVKHGEYTMIVLEAVCIIGETISIITTK